MSTSTTITISIGRNAAVANSIRFAPIPAPAWRRFRANVKSAIIDSAGRDLTIFVDGAKSTGAWDGVAEESATWVATATTFDLTYLRRRLAGQARIFLQDAIALTIGTTELVESGR